MSKFYFFRLKENVRLILISLALVFYSSVSAQAPADGLKLHYSFETATSDVVPDLSGSGYNGTLMDGATIGTSTDGKKVLILGTDGNDYLDMGTAVGGLISTLTDFSISAFVYVDPSTNLGADGNFVAVFSNSAAQVEGPTGATGFMYLQAKRSRYAISPSGWCCEEAAADAGDIAKGRWVHMAYTQSGSQGYLYIDGVRKGLGNFTLKPSGLGSTAYNYIGKPCFGPDVFLKNAMISDFRIYNRALTNVEILKTVGYPQELVTQWQALDLGNLSAVSSNITLPATLGTQGVTVTWLSSKTSVIANDGTVIRPDQYEETINLTATLKLKTGEKTDSIQKIFTAVVTAKNPAAELIAKWDFPFNKITTKGDTIKVADSSPSGFIGTVKNVAKIRTIGTTAKFNVLDLGDNNGYFDMDTLIGKAIYALGNYTIGAYFRVDASNTTLNNNGNFLWNFSNSADIAKDANGVMFGSLKIQGNRISKQHWSGEQGVSLGTNAPKGAWHHMAYSQNGTTGTLFIDGVAVKTGSVTHLPSTALPITGRTGTRYNWLGRPGYSTDSYLRKTLVYDFVLYSVPLTQGDLLETLDVDGTVAALNTAYTENPDVLLPELTAELNNLSLGNISAVTSNLTLPPKGTLDQNITIKWESKNPAISNTGVVTRGDYMNIPVQLTATLSKGGQRVTKEFVATVKANDGTGFNNDLLLNYNFAGNLVTDKTVKDAAEKQFTGTLMKGAVVDTIGPANNQHNVLRLYTDSAYFDMGKECGKLIYGLADYSVSVYFLIDRFKKNFGDAGNFLYAFSNSDSSGTARNGYIFGRATRAGHCVSSSYWASGNMATADISANVPQGKFHHFAYTQNGLVGIAYLDGKPVSTVNTFTNLPSNSVAKEGRTGTNFNFLGRPNFIGDKYLSKALLADFRLYKKALTADEITAMQDKTKNLNLAFISDSVPELLTELAALDPGDLTKITGDITLPWNGTLDPSIAISWKSSKTISVSDSGVVNRPDFIDSKVVLTATLSKDGQSITKDFPATVLANTGTGYTSDLLLNYNFADNMVNGTKVTDAAEKHFEGTLKNGAVVKAIGPAAGNKLNVLYLNTDTAYFDMGLDCGKLIYGLTDYSVSVFYLIQPSNTTLPNNGNIIYTFSNCDSAAVEKKGYMTGRATNAVHAVTSQYSETGNMQTGASTSEPTKGEFHHLVFTQSGNVATTYLDGTAVSTVQNFTNLPSSVLPKKGMLGTQYNWLGKSPYQNETYLTKAMIADFKLYKKALTSAEITAMQSQRTNLNTAYTTPVHETTLEKVRVYSPLQGVITIEGLTGTEKISVTDLLGRSIAVKDPSAIFVKPGIYIVKVDNQIYKIVIQ